MPTKITVSLLLLFTNFVYNSPTRNLITGTKPLICGENEVPTTCVEPCLPTCDIPKVPLCTYKLCLGGCACFEGYIRETIRGKCVKIESCIDPAEIRRNYTITCKDNEVPSDCSSNCEPTCDRGDMRDCAKLFCARGCVCRKGFVRVKGGGDCVPRMSCP